MVCHVLFFPSHDLQINTQSSNVVIGVVAKSWLIYGNVDIGFHMQNISFDKNSKHVLQCLKFLFCILQYVDLLICLLLFV
jgi:hypothetical protein